MTIDELVVKLGLDTKQFDEAQRKFLSDFKKTQDQGKKAADAIEDQGKRISRFFSGLKREALTVMAVFLGGKEIDQFVSHMTSVDAGVGRLSKTLNMSATELAVWQSAFEQAGGTAEDASSAFQSISSSVNSALITGNVPLFARYIGGIIDQSTGKAKTAAEVFKQLSDVVKGMDPAVATAFLTNAVPGINQTSINMLLSGRSAIDGYLESARKNVNLTGKGADEAARYQREVSNLSTAFTSLQRAMFLPMLPYITAYFERAADAITRLRNQVPNLFGGGQVQQGGTGLWLGRKLGIVGSSGSGGGGLPIKPGAGSSSSATSAVMSALSGMSEIKQVTALNDAYHQLLGGDHPRGQAIDLTVSDPSRSAAAAAAIRERLAGAGISARVRDEYVNPSAGATGGHIHISIGNVNLPNVKDADGFARELPSVVRRSSFASSFNQGPQ